TKHTKYTKENSDSGRRSFRAFRVFRGFENHRSHSPMTKSSEPRIATTSEIRMPVQIFGTIERLQNEGERIFKRHGTPPPLLTTSKPRRPFGLPASQYTSPAGICGPSVTSMKFWISSSIEERILPFGGAKILRASFAYRAPPGKFLMTCRMMRTDWRISS